MTALDCKRSTISLDDVVKIVGGVFKGKRGTIRFINKQTVFLWNKDFHQTNGLFVEQTRNIEILGAEHLRKEGAGGVASMNRMRRDPLQGKEVLITAG